MKEEIDFNYYCNYILNIIMLLDCGLYLASILVLCQYVKDSGIRLLGALIIGLLILGWLLFIKKRVTEVNGKKKKKKEEVVYTSWKKSYFINYAEIEYIAKERDFANHDDVLYRIKIKNGGSFVFKAIDGSLVDALKVLSKKSKLKIDDGTE